MSENKPKKPVIGESKIMHVGPGFAIPVSILFIGLLLCFSVLWGGVLVADTVVDNVVNPIMLRINPEAEPIDVMAVMSPPTSESEAAKVYAKFPTLDVKSIYDPFKTAFSAFPGSIKDRANNVYIIVSDLAESYYTIKPFDFKALLKWYSGELTVATAAVASEGDEIVVWFEAYLSPAIGNAANVLSKTVDTYPAAFEAWYNDHLPFRSIIFNTNQTLEGYIEEPYSDVQNKLGETANRFTTGLHVMLGETPAGNTPGAPENPGGENLENPFDPEDPFDPDNQNPGNDQPEETPPPFIENPTEPGDGTETGDQGDVNVCEHEYGKGETETPATCTDWGVMKYTCSKCGNEKREYTQKAPHDYVEKAQKDVLCGEKYSATLTCSVCSHEVTETLVKKHTPGNQLKTVEASYATYGYTLMECADCHGQYRTKIKNKLYYSGYFRPTAASDTVYVGREKWLFYRGNDSEDYFMGTNLMSDDQLREYVDVMSTLNALCKERGIQLQICIWPNKDQVYPEYLGLTPEISSKRVDRLVNYVKANSDIKIIYPIKELKAAKPYMDTYLKYDTHWNCAGGFIGYQEMMKSLGLEYTSIYDCPVYEYTGVETENVDPYYRQISGDMIGLGKLNPANYKGDHNYYIKYRTDVTVDTFSGANGAGDTRHTTASGAPNDLNFVMLADSYRVMQLTYLEKDFTDCFLTHRSHVNDADVKAAIKNSDILVIAAVERLETDILATARQIINILQEDAQ